MINSQKIALIGGGPVGIEIATEIATDYPDKEVTLIHSQEKLAGGDWLSDEFHKKLDNFMDDMKIKRVLGKYDNTAAQRQKTVPTYFISKQLLPFGFSLQSLHVVKIC